MRWGRLGAVAVAAAMVVATSSPTATATEPTTVTVDLAAPGTPVNPDLGGLSWNAGDSLEPVADIRPPTVRVDASLQDASTAEGVLDLTALLARVAEIRRIGAEPMVILSYMPRWLGTNANGRDPTRVAPNDYDKWERLIEDVVRILATAPAPAYRFEVWNEPDLPVFFQDLPTAFLDLAARTHRAVATVKAETGLPLLIGGPATAAPDPVFIVPYAQRMAADGLPLDFVSWHYYANHPFFGPDGNEGFVPDAVYQANARRNPAASPRLFGQQAALVETMLAPVLAGTDLDPELVLSEWNLSAGGYDLRHASYEGAAFVIGTLIELERGELDRADYYRALASATPNPGDWATATQQGERRPSWWAIQAWNVTVGGSVLPLTGDDPDNGFWARATRGADGVVDVFLASFSSASPASRTIDLELTGCAAATAEITRLDPGSADLSTSAPLEITGGTQTARVELPANSAAFVRVSCGTSHPESSGVLELPATT